MFDKKVVVLHLKSPSHESLVMSAHAQETHKGVMIGADSNWF